MNTDRCIGSEPPRSLEASVIADRDELLALVRHDLVHAAEGDARWCAAVLIRRALLGDSVAWRAVEREMSSRWAHDAAEALGEGNIENAVAKCGWAAGMSRTEWIAETRREIAQKAGAL